MCGLVAVINDGLAQAKLRDFIEQSLIVNTLRGHDASGVFAVNGKGECLYYKKTLPGWDFVQLQGTLEVLTYDSPRFMVGHNRSATRGYATKLDHAHPILYENIILVHNGTLTSMYDLNKGLSNKEAPYHDSTAIAMSLYRRGAIETLEMLEGAYALIWYNTLDCTLNFARNSERPLYMAQAEKSNGWLVASEQGMVKWLADRNGISIKQVAQLKEGLLMTIPLNPKESPVRRKFKVNERKGTAVTVYGGARGYNSEYNRQWWNYGYTPTKKGEVFKAQYMGTHIDGKTGKTVLRFKRACDSAWGWYIHENPSAPLQLQLDQVYTVEALEDRIAGDTGDKRCELTAKEVTAPFSTTSGKAGTGTSAKETIPEGTAMNLYQVGDEVEFLIMEIHPIRKGNGNKVNLVGNTIDDSGVEIRIYNIDENKVSIDNLYRAKVGARVYKTNGRTGEVDDYLVLDKDTIEEIFAEGEVCSWCDENLSKVGGQSVPELGRTAILCPGCLKTYHGYENRE